MKKFLSVALSLLFAFGMVACGDTGHRNDGEYVPRFSTDYDKDVDSWLQVDPGDEDITIRWFFDYSVADENLEQLIYDRTGVNVKFESAMTSDHSELTTMISGDDLPDVITVADSSLRIQLAEEGYCYPLNKLAEYYAPSMLDRVTEDHWEHYRASDDNTYALSSNFYSDADIATMEDLGAEGYAARDIAVRKDILDAYIAYKTSRDSSFDPDATITKPGGFLEMCQWAKSNYGFTPSDPTVCFAPFYSSGEELSYSITALTEMMGYAPEDKNGDLTYLYGSDAFKDAISFMNAMYKNGLVSSQNFQWEAGALTTSLQRDKPFVLIGGTQVTHFGQVALESDNYNAETDTVDPSCQYVTILLTNENGDVPLLQNYNRKGVYQSMITTNCEREDRVIKVFDYLFSEQGQREAMYGSADNYEWVLRPGETDPDTGKASTYGVIKTTDAFKSTLPSLVKNQRVQALGIRRITPFSNAAYGRMVSKEDDFIGMRHPVDWILYQNKNTYFGYTYNQADFDFTLTSTDRRVLNTYAKQQSEIFNIWKIAVPKLIMATDSAQFESIFDKALRDSESKGATEWMNTRNQFFKEYKQSRNMLFAYPKNRADYVAPEVKLRGNAENAIARPSYVYKVESK